MLVLFLEPVKGQRDCESNVPTPHWKKLAVSLHQRWVVDLGLSPRGSGKTIFAQVQPLESRFTFGSVVPMRVIYARVST